MYKKMGKLQKCWKVVHRKVCIVQSPWTWSSLNDLSSTYWVFYSALTLLVGNWVSGFEFFTVLWRCWLETEWVVFTTLRDASTLCAVVMYPFVRPSVCLSVTSRHCTKTAKRRITQTTPYNSSGTLVFLC